MAKHRLEDRGAQPDPRQAASQAVQHVYDQEKEVTSHVARAEKDAANSEGNDGLSPDELSQRERTDSPGTGRNWVDSKELSRLADEENPERPPSYRGAHRSDTADKPAFYKGMHEKMGKPGKGDLLKHGLKGFLGKHKKKIVIGGAGIGGAITLLLLIMFIAGTLLIPNFFENSLAYRFATSVRSYRQGNQQVLSRKLALDRSPDSRYGQLRQRYINMATRVSDAKKMVLLEKYRPKKVVQNMIATGALDFEESTKPTGVFRRTVVTAIIVDGERIPLAERRWYRPFGNLQDSFRLATEVDNALLKSQRAGRGILGTTLRTSIGSHILQKIGVRGLFAWANKGRDYKGTTPRTASIKLLQDKYSRVKTRPRAPSLINPVNSTAQEASDEMDKTVREGGKNAETLARTGNQPPAVTQIMERGLAMDGLRGVVSVGSTTYALAFPACIIVDTSMQRAGPLIDARMDALQKNFVIYGAAASDQQKSGDTTGEAVRALNEEMNRNGEYARTNINQTANGGNPDTTRSMMPPQGSGAGDFSILNVLLPEGAAQFANAAADQVCPTLTNVWFGLATGVVELVAGFFTGGTYTAAAKLGTAGVARAFTVYLGNFAKTLFTKQFVKRYVKQAGAIAGLALLARMITEQHAGNLTDGTAVGMDSVNERDAGGVLLNQEINRQTLGGRPQTSAEAVENNLQSREEIQRDQGARPAFERYFDLNNHQSLATKTIINVGTSINMSLVGTFLNMLAKIFNPANIASFFATAFAPKVQAADVAGRSMYQIVPMGFSVAESRAVETRATYWDVLENDFVLMEQNADKFNELKEEYSPCFTETMGTLLSEQHIVRNPDGSVVENQGKCSPQNLGMNNPKYGDLVFRWRISMRADNALVAADEVSNPGQSAASGAGGGGAVSGSGDAKALAAQLLERGKAGNIHLTSGAIQDLERTRDGIPIGSCGAVSLHPASLQVLLAISDPNGGKYFKMSINNFVTGHSCNNGQHPKGRAIDIQNINNGAVEDWGPDPGGGYRSQNPDMARKFVEALGSVMPPGSRMGQIQCAQVAAAKIPDHIQTFTDTCHHIHIDMRDVK